MKRLRRSTRSAPKVSSPTPTVRYKVQELSLVDENTLEEAINHWVRRGWKYEGTQFAMRESSKRPSMAFVLFTQIAPEDALPPTEPEQARARLIRLSRTEEHS